MPRNLRWILMPVLLMALVVGFGAQAGDVVLTNNSGTTSTRWFISGEPTLVMTGFDLQGKGVSLPTRLDKVSINVRRAMPGNPVEVVVYQDADGGSPQNATLIKRQTVDITTNGVYTVTFDAPVSVTQRFLWVGFYLPVDFEFFADTAGSSVLTYWAWTPGTVFDLNNLASAQTFGPADGSAPVNINMQGNARITAELITGSGTSTPGTTDPDLITQIVGDPNTNLDPLVRYRECQSVAYDNDDVVLTYRDSLDFYCKVAPGFLSPATPEGYVRRGLLFDVFVFGAPAGAEFIEFPVTHCINANEDIRGSAVLGVAYGAPRQWEILPSVRFNNRICAEVKRMGFMSIFTVE